MDTVSDQNAQLQEVRESEMLRYNVNLPKFECVKQRRPLGSSNTKTYHNHAKKDHKRNLRSQECICYWVWGCENCGVHGAMTLWIEQCPECEHHRCENCYMEQAQVPRDREGDTLPIHGWLIESSLSGRHSRRWYIPPTKYLSEIPDNNFKAISAPKVFEYVFLFPSNHKNC